MNTSQLANMLTHALVAASPIPWSGTTSGEQHIANVRNYIANISPGTYSAEQIREALELFDSLKTSQIFELWDFCAESDFRDPGDYHADDPLAP
jgi:hypothetical protein